MTVRISTDNEDLSPDSEDLNWQWGSLTWQPAGIKGVGREDVGGEVVQGHPDPRHPRAAVGRRHEEDREGDQAQDEADHHHGDPEALEILLRGYDSYKLLDVKFPIRRENNQQDGSVLLQLSPSDWNWKQKTEFRIWNINLIVIWRLATVGWVVEVREVIS